MQVLTPRKLDSDFDQSMEAEEDQAARVIEPKGNSFFSIHFLKFSTKIGSHLNRGRLGDRNIIYLMAGYWQPWSSEVIGK